MVDAAGVEPADSRLQGARYIPASSYASFGSSGWTQTSYGALMRRLAIHIAFAATELAWEERLELS